jgi:hypothetical protein
MAILMAFILLSIAAVVTVSLSRTAIREALITSNESTGRKAYEMADSGIDYLITWSNTPYVTAPSATAVMIATNYQTLLNAIDPSNNTFTGMDSDGTIKVTMLASNIGGDLTPGTTGYLQTTSVVQPAFDLELRYLGHPFATPKSKGPAFYIAHSTGRANIGGTGQSFTSRREALVY